MKSLNLKQLGQKWRRAVGRWGDRDPLKKPIDPYLDWHRLFLAWTIGVVIIFIFTGFGYWWLNGIEARIRLRGETAATPLVDRTKVLRLVEELNRREAVYERYQRELPALVDPSR